MSASTPWWNSIAAASSPEAEHIEQLIATPLGWRSSAVGPGQRAIVHETVAAPAAAHLAQQQARGTVRQQLPRRG